jgi:hypothetical protein
MQSSPLIKPNTAFSCQYSKTLSWAGMYSSSSSTLVKKVRAAPIFSPSVRVSSTRTPVKMRETPRLRVFFAATAASVNNSSGSRPTMSAMAYSNSTSSNKSI